MLFEKDITIFYVNTRSGELECVDVKEMELQHIFSKKQWRKLVREAEKKLKVNVNIMYKQKDKKYVLSTNFYQTRSIREEE